MTNRNTTKRALLTSVLAIFLCLSMFVGTTFAWFTDSVTSAGNKIVSGSLKVDLEVLDETDNTTWTSVKEDNAAIFNYTNWEPGYVQVKVLRVVNEGTLALKWKAALVSTNGLSDLANVIDVYVKEDVTTYPANRADIADWTHVGTLAEFVNSIETTTTGEILPNETKDAHESLGIAFKMQETAGNEYQEMTLGEFDIKILATQLTYEEDSFDDQYDAGAELPDIAEAFTQDELNAAISAGADTIYLAAGTYTLPATSNGEFAIVGDADTVIDITNSVNMSGSDITFDGVTVKSDNGGFNNGIQHVNTITYENATIVGSRSLYGAKEVFNNCTFDLTGISDYIWTYGAKEVEFNNCVFYTQGKAILVYNEGTVGSSLVSINNCSFYATQSGYTGAGDQCAAVEIDGSLIPGTYTVNFNGTNTVSDYFAGISRIKAQKDPSNVTVNQNGTVVTTSALPVSSAEQLADALENGKNVIMTNDVDAGEQVFVNKGTLDGGNNTIVVSSGDAAYESGLTVTEGTVKNITVTGAFRGLGVGGSGASEMTGDVVYENVTVTGATYGINIGIGNGYKVTMINCTLPDWNSYSGLGSAQFTGCTFTSEGSYYASQRISANATFTYTNCNFEQNTYNNSNGTENYYLDSYGGGTIVFENCYMNGVLITEENVDELFQITEKVTVVVKNS